MAFFLKNYEIFEKSLRPLSMVPARVPHKFWPVPQMGNNRTIQMNEICDFWSVIFTGGLSCSPCVFFVRLCLCFCLSVSESVYLSLCVSVSLLVSVSVCACFCQCESVCVCINLCFWVSPRLRVCWALTLRISSLIEHVTKALLGAYPAPVVVDKRGMTSYPHK